MYQIVGLMMVKNEDRFVERSILGIIDFCDVLYVDDNESSDETFARVAVLAQRFPKIKLRTISETRQSNEHLEPLCGRCVWVFAVDGDELYERERLAEFRKVLLTGAYDQYWCVSGNMLHVFELSDCETVASGHLSPPAMSVTKLYNFGLISAFPVVDERLHGHPEFNARYDPAKHYCRLNEDYSWDNTPFRCVHVAFVPRSSKRDAVPSLLGRRMNPRMIYRFKKDWKQRGVLRAAPQFAWLLLQCMFKRESRMVAYHVGPRVSLDVSSFTRRDHQ